MNYPEDYIGKVIQGDCLEVMKGMPDKCVDLIVTSPPYDNLRDYGGYIFNFKDTAMLLCDKLKEGGVIVWIVGDQCKSGGETGTSFRQALYFQEIGLTIHDTMIYKKSGLTYPEVNRYYQCFEYMFVFSKGKPKTINLIEDKINKTANSLITGNKREKDGSLKEMSGSKCGRRVKERSVRWNVWEYNTGWGHSYTEDYLRGHPGIFPEKLVREHVISWSEKKDIILDPFLGSEQRSSLRRTETQMDRHRKKTKYCEIARQRLSQVQKEMFT